MYHFPPGWTGNSLVRPNDPDEYYEESEEEMERREEEEEYLADCKMQDKMDRELERDKEV